VLQRLGRHAEAAEAYRSGLAIQSSIPQAWLGLGISLEALQQRAAAADAFRSALAAGPVSPELRSFAEQRIRALR
jgi:MSHA biogenesis protein MshN